MRILDLDFQEIMFKNVSGDSVMEGFQCEREDRDDCLYLREIGRGFVVGCVLACWLFFVDR
jgi:hypothetical protein